jgi:hypothetical protein
MNPQDPKAANRFFRVLADGVDVRRWRNRDFNSTHEQPPTGWYKIYHATRSERPEDYPLSSRPGGPDVFTEKARRAFVDCIKRYGIGQIWPREDRMKVGEMAGTCAYRDPQAALNYAREKGEPFFVVFTATLVDEEIPEKPDGGVLVHPLETLDGPMPRSEFLAKWDPSSASAPS